MVCLQLGQVVTWMHRICSAESDLWASKRDGPFLLVLVFVKGNPEESGLLWVLKQKHQIKLEGVPKDPNMAMLRKDLTAYGTI
ncbi:hypothetical protein SAY87_002881 [Trapa incisa]|uniref:Uncharacterized protein n=1 Tax=Trapa incisa TaxID=236973 RepID=A0AAN7KQG6_9MYRT|nr:hypothetical protein SAY87_002881 [Trapa incisa]